MFELMAKLSGRELIGLVAVVGAFTTVLSGIGWCWFLSWKAHRHSQALMALKHSMVERGFASDEIERVAEAGISSSADTSVA